MMAEPPFDAGAVNETVRVPSVEVMPEIVGAPGAVYGVPALGEEAEPGPTTFTAFKETEYEVPFARPVIISGEDVETGERVVQFAPPSDEY
jgi:hypothetical protein